MIFVIHKNLAEEKNLIILKLLIEDNIDGNLRLFGQERKELPYAHKDAIGCTVDYVAGRKRYMGYLISLGVYSFKGMKVGLDCANGSSWNIAKSIFEALGNPEVQAAIEQVTAELGDSGSILVRE